jgi:hypothetical protein
MCRHARVWLCRYQPIGREAVKFALRCAQLSPNPCKTGLYTYGHPIGRYHEMKLASPSCWVLRSESPWSRKDKCAAYRSFSPTFVVSSLRHPAHLAIPCRIATVKAVFLSRHPSGLRESLRSPPKYRQLYAVILKGPILGPSSFRI